MARSVITANQHLGTNRPENLKGSIGVDISVDQTPPAGYSVGIAGMLDNSGAGGYGMVFSFGVPARMKVDEDKSGSGEGPERNFDYMYVETAADPNSTGGSTEYWEVWFNAADVEGDDWNSMVQLSINGTTYTYTLTKKRTGDDL